MQRLLGISVLVFFSLFFSLSCTDNSTKSPLLALASGSDVTDPSTTGGGTDVQGQKLSDDDVVVVLATIMDAIKKIPWGDLQDKLSLDKSGVSGGSSTSTGPAASVATGYTITLYEETGLKVDAGIANDWSGFILNITLSGYKMSSSINIAVSGSLNIFATFTDWTVVKLVMNTLPNAKLSISGIPLIKPTVALTDVTINFDFYNLAIVETAGSMGTINIMGYSFAFDPSWITKIMDLLTGILPSA
jgi:hypothetical protein